MMIYAVNEFAGVIENVGAEIGEPVRLDRTIGHVAEKNRDVVIGIRRGVAARARPVENDTIEARTVRFIERSAEAGQNRIGGRGLVHNLIIPRAGDGRNNDSK